MKIEMDKYFLEEVCPFNQRRSIKWKNVKIAGFCTLGVGILALLAFTPSEDKVEAPEPIAQNVAQNRREGTSPAEARGEDPFARQKPTSSLPAARPERQHNASQVVRRADGTGGDKLPMGTTVKAKLTNTVLSSDSNSPVIAEIEEDVYWKNARMIPAGTKVIGQGSLQDSTERLQVRFHTLVFPEGEQHQVSALALLENGSSGLAGDFHSRAFPKHAGRFFGTFVGGLAQGLKDKDSRGQAGIVFEPGSLKNGVLNGVATSSLDLAHESSQSTEQLHPYLEVPGGTVFLIYFEREFSP